jgi:S-adenosylmethionine-dependent methyltransferase
MTAAADRNFDDIADKLTNKIYGTIKGKIRLAVLQRDLDRWLALDGGQPLNILDAGGGVGQFSSLLACKGHRITFCDISEKMIGKAREHYALHAPGADVHFIHAPLQSLNPDQLQPFDLILCHAVLEWLAQPRDALTGLLILLKPGGRISTLFYNRHSLMMLYLIRGRFDKVMQERLGGWGNSLTPINPQDPDAVLSWFQDWGYATERHSGVRCFYDYVTAKRRDEFNYDDVLAAELKMSTVDAFRSTARYIHLLCRKPE